MATLVIPGVCRFQVYGQIGPRPWANTVDLDFAAQAPVSGGSLHAVAEKLMDLYYANVRALCVTAWDIRGCRWVDLHSVNGSTGEITDTPLNTFPAAGTATGDACPGNTSVMAVKHVDGGRSIRNGRTYFCGIPESHTTGNQLVGAQVTAWNAALSALWSGYNGSVGSVAHFYVVGGVNKAGVTHKTTVSTYQADALLATQRRRMRA